MVVGWGGYGGEEGERRKKEKEGTPGFLSLYWGLTMGCLIFCEFTLLVNLKCKRENWDTKWEWDHSNSTCGH